MNALSVPRAGQTRVVVVGHGNVGHRFVEALRQRDKSRRCHVTVLAEENRPAYDRVTLSSWFTHRTDAELRLTPLGTADDPDLAIHLGEPVVSIDRESRSVRCASGRSVPYDELILATGSSAFVPPVPGAELPGVFVYRTITDLEKISSWSARARCGVVVGGGLLGLEAAGALLELGLRTAVVEAAPWLMPLQVDAGGGALLASILAARGVLVCTGVGTARLERGSDGAVARLVRTDGAVLDADLVVMAAGIRPRDQLARDCGLPVGERGGIVVDERCATPDPRIWAVGECALAAGRLWGLVAPGYAMAEVAVDALLGGGATFTGADTATKLKLVGVDVASFGDAMATTPDALEVVFSDPVAGTYRKLVVSDDATTLLGGVLVGDASSYAMLRPLVGSALSAAPGALLAPEAGGSPLTLPADAPVCACRGVSAGDIHRAVGEAGCRDVTAVKACTTAGTVCGSCLPLVKKIVDTELAAAGHVVDRSLCEHFAMTRVELYEVIRATGLGTFTEVSARYGRGGRGCDICKPVVASVLSSLGRGHVLDGELAALQDTNDHFLANLQKNGTYSVVPRVPGGEITPDQLILLGELAREFQLYTKITGAQRIDLLGATVEQLPAIWQRLVDGGMESGHAYGKALRTVKSCVGSAWCRYGVQDSVSMAILLELRYRGLRSPHKIKGGVSGCARECAEAQSKDFGVIATERGWNLYVGGNGGFRPRHAQLLAENLDDETLVRTIDRYLMFYVRTADRLQRTAPWLDALEGGVEHLRAVIMADSIGICADLDAQLRAHLADYRDEWEAVLCDPDKRARFVSFVNAPDTPDGTVTFVPERGQRRPGDPVLVGLGGLIPQPEPAQ